MVQHVLDDRERLELIAKGNAAFVELIGRLFSNEVGRKARHKASVDIHERRRSGRPTHQDEEEEEEEEERGYLSLFDRHTIRATLEEVADLYLNEDKKMVLDFSESRELVALQRPSARTPLEYTGMRWSLYRSPNRAVAKDQDFCYLEVMKPFTAPSGRRGWAKCSHSLDHRICPDLSASPKIAVNRGRLHYCGVFFVETDEPGMLDGIFYYNVERANIPALLAPVVMKARGRNNARLLNHYAKMSRLSAHQQQRHGGMSSSSKAAFAKQLQAERRCGACSDRLPGWKSRAKCVFCKAYMCKKCSSIVKRNYRVRNIGRNHVCFTCAEQHGARLASSSSAEAAKDAASDTDSASFHFDDTDTVASSYCDGDDAVSSVATATDDESEGAEGDDDDHHHPHQEGNGAPVPALRQRSSSGSASNAVRARSTTGIRHVPLDPTAALAVKHRPASVTGSAMAVSSLHAPIHKSRSASNLAHMPQLHLRPPPPPPLPMPAYQRRPRPMSSDKVAAAFAGSAALGSPTGLSLDQVNLRDRSQTTSAVPSRSNCRETISGSGRSSQRDRAATTAAYSRDNPCDLSYLDGFK